WRGLSNLPSGKTADGPNQARARSIGRGYKGIALLAAVRVLEFRDRPKAPSVRQRLGDQGKPVIDRGVGWPCQERGQFGVGAGCTNIKPQWFAVGRASRIFHVHDGLTSFAGSISLR